MTYNYNGYPVIKARYFIYRISLYRHLRTFRRYETELLKERTIATDKPLQFKTYNTITYYDGYSLEKEITPIGVPQTEHLEIWSSQK